jgi:hypothetical protein
MRTIKVILDEIQNLEATVSGMNARLEELRGELEAAQFGDSEHLRQLAEKMTEKFNAARDAGDPVL